MSNLRNIAPLSDELERRTQSSTLRPTAPDIVVTEQTQTTDPAMNNSTNNDIACQLGGVAEMMRTQQQEMANMKETIESQAKELRDRTQAREFSDEVLDESTPLRRNSPFQRRSVRTEPDERGRDVYTPMRDITGEGGYHKREPLRPPAGSKEIKIPDPPMFDGKYEELTEFIVKLRNCFRHQQNKFWCEDIKVRYAISRMEGMAFKAISSSMELAPADQPLYLHDFDALVRFLKDSFGNANERGIAVREIYKIRQVKDDASLYFTRFMQYAPITGWNTAALIDQAYHGLREGIKDELMQIDWP
jgi:hypothetical protein